MDAMILSAGLGMRMRPLTDHTPKALLRVGPHRLIEFHLINLSHAGYTNVVINTSYLADMFEEVLGDGSDYGVQINYSHEGESPLETGGGIRKALPLIQSEKFLIVNADIWTNFPFTDLNVSDHEDGCLIVVDNPAHHPKGEFQLINGMLQIPEFDDDTLTYSGISMLRKSLFANVNKTEFPLNEIFRQTISCGKLAGQYHSGFWFDIGTAERLQELNSLLLSKSDE